MSFQALVAAWLLAAAVVAQGEARATRLHVEAWLPDAEAEHARGATIRLVPTAGAGHLQAIEARLAVPGELMIEVPDDHTWQVRGESQDLWGEPQWVSLRAGEAARELRLRFFPAGWITATLLPPAGQELPVKADLRFEPAPGVAAGGPSRATVSCEVAAQERNLRCKLPLGVVDLRLKVGSFIPLYLWSVHVPTDLGRVELRAGASVSGWVSGGEQAVSPAGAMVELEPKETDPLIPVPKELRQQLGRKAMVNRQGFFQLAPVEPGAYTVTLSKPGLATTGIELLLVKANLESEIRDPLVLARPVAVKVRIDPPLDPFGAAWRVTLSGIGPASRSELKRAGTASPQGAWEATGIPAGRYDLSVESSRASVWSDQSFEAHPGDPPVLVSLGALAVRGHVRRGDRPVPGTLSLQEVKGLRRVRFPVDEHGQFEGFLPAEGSWRIEVAMEKPRLRVSLAPVTVKRLAGASRAVLEIEVPNTRLAGDVFDEEGHAVAHAIVLASANQAQEWQGTGQATTADDGTFELAGLTPGPLQVQATTADLDSGWQVVNLAEGEDSTVHLIARKVVTVYGRVSSNGNPVPGALIAGLPDWGRSSGVSGVQTMSGADGGFSLELPGTAVTADLGVFAYGHAGRILRIQIDPKTFLELSVEPVGGTLIVEGPESGTPRELVLRRALLSHGGALLPLELVAGWASEHTPGFQRDGESSGPQRGAEEAGTAFALPGLEAGDYQVCYILRFDPSQPNLPATCNGGTLHPLEELRVALPKPPPSPSLASGQPSPAGVPAAPSAQSAPPS